MTNEHPNIGKKKNNNLVIGIFAGIIILGGVGAIAYFTTKNNEQNPDVSLLTIQQLQSQADQLEQTLNQPQHLTKTHLKTKLTNLKGKIQIISQENSPNQGKLQQLEQEIKKIQQELGLPDNPPNPPEETVDQLGFKVIKEIKDALKNSRSLGWAEVKQGDLFNNWIRSITDADSKDSINLFRENALKDISQIKLTAPKERQKLKDYFVFCPHHELNLRWVDNKINVRDLSSDLVTDLNQAIRGKGTWQRKFMAFTGGFNINSEVNGHQFDDWVRNNKNIWIVIKKDHNSSQYNTEKNTFFLKKGSDYHEFNSRREAVAFLESNDSYFK